MTRPHKLGAFVTAIVLAMATSAASGDPAPAPPVTAAPVTPALTPEAADPGTLHLQTPSTVTTDGGSTLRLPPGYFLPEPEYKRQDTLLKSLGDDKTNLTAQNKSLRESTSGWQPGWKTIASALIAGIALGIYVDHKL